MACGDGSDAVLTLRDNRTGKNVDIALMQDEKMKNSLPIIAATEFEKKLGIRLYDPGYVNTAVAKSSITYIDGERGVLRFRGYAIEDLCEKCSFLDVAHLLIKGNLPTANESSSWKVNIMQHSFLDEQSKTLLKSFRHDSHPMGQLIAAVASLSTIYPEANPAISGRDIFNNSDLRGQQVARIVGKVATLAACAYRNTIGRPYNDPDTTGATSYVENFMAMLDRLGEPQYKLNPRLVRVMEILFILHADHEINCSTAAVRHLASSGVDPFTAISGGIGALYGPLHGGANEAVVRMLQKIGSKENIPEFLRKVKNRKEKLMGFGHRVYKNYDPRAKIIKKYAYEVFEIVGEDELMDVALELERQALQDEFFIKRKLFPNVDFYSGLIYKAMGFPVEMFPVLFAVPRTIGWLSHWLESLADKETKIVRPRQVYIGSEYRQLPMYRSTHKPESGIVSCTKVLRFHSKF